MLIINIVVIPLHIHGMIYFTGVLNKVLSAVRVVPDGDFNDSCMEQGCEELPRPVFHIVDLSFIDPANSRFSGAGRHERQCRRVRRDIAAGARACWRGWNASILIP